MTLKTLLEKKDFDYIEWRVTAPKGIDVDTIFFGHCMSKNGKLISLDGDNYSEDKEIISYKEWYTRDIKNGLTVIVQGEWA